jgi:hypothetical protein
LNASAIDKDINAASHGIQSFLKNVLYGIEVAQIAINKLCADGVQVGWRIILWFP